ncbi:hypothetical protein [Sphingomonas paeninsulae]|uniref:DUF7936 family protein n=1 Tax=Sphingomonas paeninsulae TaxID=2319844 RepID=UPI0013CE4A9F|nr:hypothetical protein [Sphingomonas paeninsulae]
MTYTWSFPTLQVAPSQDGLENVVTAIGWRLTATNDPHSASIAGCAGIEHKAGEFTPFAELTEATVTRWLEADLGDEFIVGLMLGLDRQLADLANPPIVTLIPPWVVPEVPVDAPTDAP